MKPETDLFEKEQVFGSMFYARAQKLKILVK